MRLLKYSLVFLSGLVVLVVGGVLLIPVERYIPEAERGMSALLERPVKIGRLGIHLFPVPHLTIGAVVVGEHADVALAELEVRFDVQALLGHRCVVSQVSVEHGALAEAAVAELFEWLMSPVPAIQEPVYCQVRQLDFRDFHLDVPDMPQDGVSGSVRFTGSNDPEQILLHFPQFDLTADVRPKPDGTFHVDASTPGWGMPDIPDMKLEQVRAVGDISDAGFDMRELTGRLMGVSLRGKGALSWEPVWSLSGEVNLSGDKVRHEIKALDGRMIGFDKLSGHGLFRSRGGNPDQLVVNLTVDADMKSSGFVLELEPQAKQPLSFERFDTHIAYTPEAIRLQRIDARLAGGALTGAMTLLPSSSLFRFDLSPRGVNPQPVVRSVDDALLLSGVLDADIKGVINLDHLQDFPAESRIDGRFDIRQGELGESKLVRAVNSNIPKTEEDKILFDQISSELLIDDAGYHLSKLKIIASVFNAEGRLNIAPDDQVDGVLATDLKGMAGLVSLPLRVTGSLSSPTVRPTGGVVAGAAIGTALLGPVGTAIGIRAGALIDRMWQGKEGAEAPAAASEKSSGQMKARGSQGAGSPDAGSDRAQVGKGSEAVGERHPQAQPSKPVPGGQAQSIMPAILSD